MFSTKPKKQEYHPEYDDEPVLYCADCHSLLICCDEEAVCEEWDGTYCGKCGSTNIASCSIQEWLAEEERLFTEEDDL